MLLKVLSLSSISYKTSIYTAVISILYLKNNYSLNENYKNIIKSWSKKLENDPCYKNVYTKVSPKPMAADF